MDILKCYKTLGLPPDATLAETKHAYRKLVNHWHPDRFARDDALHLLAEEQLKLLNIAYAEIQKHQSTRPRRYRAQRSPVSRPGATRRRSPGLRPARPPAAGRVPAVLNRLTRKFRQMLSDWVSAPARPVRSGKPAGRRAASHPARGKHGNMLTGAAKTSIKFSTKLPARMPRSLKRVRPAGNTVSGKPPSPEGQPWALSKRLSRERGQQIPR